MHTQTRKNSSRMRTAHLQTVVLQWPPPDVAPGALKSTRLNWSWVGPRSDVREPHSSDVTCPMMHLMLLIPRPSPEQADACENITFSKLRLRAVTSLIS